MLNDEYEAKKAAYRSFVGHYREARQSLVKAYHLGLEPEPVQGFHTWKPVEVLYRAMVNGKRAKEKARHKEQQRLRKERRDVPASEDVEMLDPHAQASMEDLEI